MSYLITGVAGFIGFHTARFLLERGEEVVGVDNLNAYYSPKLKNDRLGELERFKAFRFHQIDLADSSALNEGLKPYRFRKVVHLAAQAGVRHSLSHPEDYVASNLIGHFNVLEYCRRLDGLDRLTYASSSSVYGGSATTPSRETDRVDSPVSFYAATKCADELMSRTYAHLYGLPQTGLRFFTVYGPWGRPDMALWLFTEAILAGRPIKVYNFGRMRRDFTYIDDLIPAVAAAADDDRPPPTGEPPHRLYNIGGSHSEELLYLIEVLENALGRKALTELLPLQPGDVVETGADVSALARDFGFDPKTRIEMGIPLFVEWYKVYHGA